MGMYTELNFACSIKNAPDFVLKTIKKMIEGDEVDTDWPEETRFFGDSRIYWMFNSASYYHHPVPVNRLENLNGEWFLSARFNIKNYNNEIETFIEWLTPFMSNHEGEFLGYKRYEEDERPSLLFHPNKWVL